MLTEGSGEGARFTVTHVDRLAKALGQVTDTAFAAILLDLSLPDAHGIEIVTRLHEAAPSVPIVIMSGNQDEALAIRGVREGAQDYLVKGRVESDVLVRSLRYAIERTRIEDRLNAKTREQETFIYTVSHDLKAPLVSIQGMAGILSADYGAALGADGGRYLERIVANADKMQALLADLLELSRIGRVDDEYGPVDLAAVIQDVTEQLHHTLAVRGARIEVAPSLPVVYACGKRLVQVFTNLIDNAVKYTPEGRAPLVRITARDEGGAWDIAVRDNGVGIPPEFHTKVLQIFQRLPVGKTLNPTGTGVGLAIVARIIETHGGRVWIVVEEGMGTTFHVTLPKREPRRQAQGTNTTVSDECTVSERLYSPFVCPALVIAGSVFCAGWEWTGQHEVARPDVWGIVRLVHVVDTNDNGTGRSAWRRGGTDGRTQRCRLSHNGPRDHAARYQHVAPLSGDATGHAYSLLPDAWWLPTVPVVRH